MKRYSWKWFSIVGASLLGLFGMIGGMITNDDLWFTWGLIWVAIGWISGDIVTAKEEILNEMVKTPMA